MSLNEKEMNMIIVGLVMDKMILANKRVIEQSAQIASEIAANRVYKQYEKEEMGYKFGNPCIEREERIAKLEKALIPMEENFSNWKDVLTYAVKTFV